MVTNVGQQNGQKGWQKGWQKEGGKKIMAEMGS